MRRGILVTIVLLLALRPAAAQFYATPNGPAVQRLKHVLTDGYDVVYPAGMDSLALDYARRLESARIPVSEGLGFVPGCNMRRRFPVILHTSDCYSNGLVSWTPHRMELITTPQADAPLSLPWAEQLAIHESRHAAQMQYINAPKFRVWRLLSGELFGGALSALYCGPSFFEGDAVVAETELSGTGRGRSADFLEYWRACFAEGDMRNWERWRWGSLDRYTPDYYTVGYVTMNGMRSVYGEPDFTRRYFDRLLGSRAPLPTSVWNKTVRDVSGKNFRDAFAEICDTLAKQWKRDMDARGPFMPMTQLTPTTKKYTEHTDNAYLREHIFDIHRGLYEAPTLMRTDPDGIEKRVSPFSSSSTGLKPEPGRERIYWSEVVPDLRWSDRSWSEIHYCHDDGRHHRLTRRTRYFNPAPSPDGALLSVTEYTEEGGSAVVVLDPDNGRVINRVPAPAGMQVVETEWAENELVASAITEDGIGLYHVGSWETALEPCFSSIKELWHHDGSLYFTSDRSGVNELYRVCLATGSSLQLTNTPFGASEFQFNDSADTLFYSAITPQGRFLYYTPAASLPVREVRGFDAAPEVLAPECRPGSEYADGSPTSVAGGAHQSPEISAPAPYSRMRNLFRVHSWLPFYIDFDSVSELSFESVMSSAGLGATAFTQNLPGTLEGCFGYRAAPSAGRWFHSGHAKFTYKGLFPVIEASFDYGSGYALDYYNCRQTVRGKDAFEGLISDGSVKRPSGSANLTVYVPLNFSSDGRIRGVVPQLSYGITNDHFCSDFLQLDVNQIDDIHPADPESSEAPSIPSVVNATRKGDGTYVNMSRLGISLRGYSMLATAPSCMYPKMGIGAEIGYSSRPGAVTTDPVTGKTLDFFNSNVYGFVYGYLPGIVAGHGIRLSAIAQSCLGGRHAFGESYASTSPRGLAVSSLMARELYGSQAKFTFDYALPFASVDWNFLSPAAYIRNFELKPHFDLSWYGDGVNGSSGTLFSAGTDLCARLGNFLWVPYLTRIGVSWSFNGGSLYDSVASMDRTIGRNSFSLVFEIDL